MTVSDEQRQAWHGDAQVAVQLADQWESSSDMVAVRIPRIVAERAVEAWERPGEVQDEVTGLSAEDATGRRAAGTLALIGAALSERGRWGAAEATVDVSLAVVCELVRTSAGTDAPTRD